MKTLALSLLVILHCYEATALNLPGPLVYVVTPSSKSRDNEGRSAPQPFYYHNWMRRMDSIINATTTTTTTTAKPKIMTPDLIFAEFESGKMKNIRKLLEKERIENKLTTKLTTTTTTSKPIYVPDDDIQEPQNVHYGLPSEQEEIRTKEKDMTDYFALYNNLYNTDDAPPAPVYLPTISTIITTTTTPKPSTTQPTSTTTSPIDNMENIWHIIDNQKHDEYTGKWEEIPVGSNSEKNSDQAMKSHQEEEKQLEAHQEDEEPKIDENFALPGFGTNPGIGGENESRAIRTEPNIRFPYINLKPFQMKRPVDGFANSKKGNNMYTNLDNFIEVKHPVRGEVQDSGLMRQPIDRYNPAQPYLPSEYGSKSKSKQSTPNSKPIKTVANLVPPPPPPPPRITDNDFPAPSTYEQFPPFAPSPADDDGSPPAPASGRKPPVLPPPMDSFDSDTGTGDDAPTMDLGYRYKPPSASTPNFLPTLPPLQKPFRGYSYDKPVMTSYDKPPMTMDAPPVDSDFEGYNYDKPPTMPDKPDYTYSKPEPSAPAPPPPSYGHHHDSDYPELIYNKPHDHGPKGADDMKGGDDSMGMVPPPMADVKPGPPDDSGFPHDFPGDFKYHHDFDDHDFHHYHHHTTTTTTTEMPRVNRYSYYYLGKKLYYLPLYFSVYFIVYVGALIIKAVLRHKIVYPNSWRPNDMTASYFSKRSVDLLDSSEHLHDITRRVTRAIAAVAERYVENKKENNVASAPKLE